MDCDHSTSCVVLMPIIRKYTAQTVTIATVILSAASITDKAIAINMSGKIYPGLSG